MTITRCIRGKAKRGEVREDQAEEAASLFDEFAAELRHKNAPRPEEQAASMTADALKSRAKTRKRAALQQVRAQMAIRARIESNSDDPVEAALSLLDFDARGNIAGPNVRIMGDMIRGQAHARMVEVMEQFRSRAAGLDVAARAISPKLKQKHQVSLRNLVRELYGESSGSRTAKDAARGVSEGFEYLRKLFNASGGNIPKRADWGLPQFHNRRTINAAPEDEWVDFVSRHVDRNRMIDLDTDQPFTDGKLRRVLSGVYKDIVTDGLNSVQPGGAPRRGIAARRATSRFLVFRNADAWFAYNERFGESDAFQIILGHVNSMSRDIAMMRVLGPNPDASVRFMENATAKAQGETALAQTGKEGARAAARIGQGQPKIRDLYAAVSGTLHHPGNEFWANISGANRNIVTSAMLGSAFFSAIADRTFSRAISNLNGIPASQVMVRHLRSMLPGRLDDQRLAVQSGFIADAWNGVAIAEQRYFGEVIGPEWSKRIADTVLRASLLSPWTTGGRAAFQLEFLGALTRSADQTFDQLNPALRASLARHGVTDADWDIFRSTQAWVDDRSGARFIRPQDIAGEVGEDGPLFQKRFDIAAKFQGMILTETDFAIPTTTARTRALVTFGKQPGTLAGEITRNVFLFKSFPITLITTHLRRAVFGNITRAQKAKYLAHLIIGTAIMGTLGEQMSQISSGRDPLPLDPTTEQGRKVWLKGMTRGGGLGLFGDFLFSDVNRYGGGLESMFLGPIFGSEVPQAVKLTIGNMRELVVEGETKNAGRELTRFTKLMLPGRSLWYTRLALERMLFDEIQKTIDPDYARSFRAMRSRSEREFGQQFFSPPGSGFPPKRVPELERALQ